jgi:hypothetical protein
MTLTVDTVLAFFNVQFPQFTAQTKAERDLGEKITPAYLSYNNFYTYWSMANTRLSVDLAAHGNMPISENEGLMCVCCLIADMREKSNPDWAYTSESTDAEGNPKMSVSRNGKLTSYMMQYNDIILAAWKRYSARGVKPFNGTENLPPSFTHNFGQNLYSPVVNFNYWSTTTDGDDY